MDVEQTADDAMAPASDVVADLKAALIECEPDRKHLQGVVEELLKQQWTESIFIVEECLRVTAPSNRHLLSAYKNRILNEGNRLKRLLPSLLKNYLVRQVFETVVVTKKIPGEGPWGLPAGVKMPPSMQLSSN